LFEVVRKGFIDGEVVDTVVGEERVGEERVGEGLGLLCL